MFVVEALVLTLVTTPLVTAFYPQQARIRASCTGANFCSVADQSHPVLKKLGPSNSIGLGEISVRKTRFTVVLDKIEHVPGMMALTHLLMTPVSGCDVDPLTASGSHGSSTSWDTFVNPLRLIGLSDNFSAAMISNATDALQKNDALLGIFRVFGELNNLHISPSLLTVPYNEFANTVADYASENSSDLILVSWKSLPDSHTTSKVYNPFQTIFRSVVTTDGAGVPASHPDFIHDLFSQSKMDMALFIDSEHGQSDTFGGARHIYLPFFGGPDDRLALQLTVQACVHPSVSATVVRVMKRLPNDILEPAPAHLCDERYGDPRDTASVIASSTRL